MKILHITTHLGKGAGVCLPYFKKVRKRYSQKVICLGYVNSPEKEFMKKIGVPLYENMSVFHPQVLNLIDQADVVLVHWWNHPLMMDFLIREKLPPCRLIFWAYTSGLNPPNNFTNKALKYPDKFIFMTPVSWEAKEVKRLKDKSHLDMIWATGGFDRVKGIKLKEHKGFNVGYVGTADKMHPEFFSMCEAIKIPDVRFIAVGGPQKLMGRKYKLTGYVSEAKKWEYLATFDVFGYPLDPHHYGTCDLVLQEAMAVGIPPVVMENPMELYMVHDGVGRVVEDKWGYVKAIYSLYYNEKLRKQLGKNAKSYARDAFSLDTMVKKWDEVFDEVIKLPKRGRKWKAKSTLMPKDIFIEALGNYGNCFKGNDTQKIKELAKSANWRSQTKSTVHNYSAYFPDDSYLRRWSELMG